jgi:hypothetical protein
MKAENEYPELDEVALKIESLIINQINKSVKTVKTICPYPAQCVLEILISKLEKSV